MDRNDAEKLIKPKFEAHYREMLGTRYDAFIDSSLSFLRRSIRVNTLKILVSKCVVHLQKNFSLKPIPWCPEGFWISHPDRRDIGNTLAHSLGYIYIQEAASMIPAVVLNPRPDERVLDMCASPGSKATQIAALMRNKGLLIANDFRHDRISSLGLNLQRCGASNVIINQKRGQLIRDIQFDRILVDAPCSGTGTIRKNLKTLTIWNSKMISRLAAQQYPLLRNAFSLLKPGGTLVYSTCSVEPEENEGVVSRLLKEYHDACLVAINLDIQRSNPFRSFQGQEYHPSVDKCLRLFPQDNDTEGFFVAKIHKRSKRG